MAKPASRRIFPSPGPLSLRVECVSFGDRVSHLSISHFRQVAQRLIATGRRNRIVTTLDARNRRYIIQCDAIHSKVHLGAEPRAETRSFVVLDEKHSTDSELDEDYDVDRPLVILTLRFKAVCHFDDFVLVQIPSPYAQLLRRSLCKHSKGNPFLRSSMIIPLLNDYLIMYVHKLYLQCIIFKSDGWHSTDFCNWQA